MSDTVMSLTLSVIAVFVGTQALLWRAIVVLQRETARSFGAFRDEIKGDFATLRDNDFQHLQEHVTRLDHRIDKVEQNLFGARQELHALIVAVRTEVNAEIKDARDDLNSEIKVARNELNAEIKVARNELKSEIDGVRKELKSEFDNRLGATESRLLDAIDRLAA